MADNPERQHPVRAKGAVQARIEDHGLIGDCETAALVTGDGTIDWLCWPRFDSDACFAALLGGEENGFWRVAPRAEARLSRRYRPGTLILETRFETETSAATLIDFMPPRDRASTGGASHIVRIVVGERGRLAMRMELALRLGYGRTIPWVSRLPDGRRSAIAGPVRVVLASGVEMRGEDMRTVADFEIAAGQRHAFVLSHGPSHQPAPATPDAAEALAATEAFWRDWLKPARIDGPWREAVERSLITLKAMTYAPTGGLVAAPTTSLPEEFGGERNWDYRYCWIRDSTLTLLSMLNTGFKDEAAAWLAWLRRAVAGDPADMQIMYGLAGERRLSEWTADWLAGHAHSRPVRIGNAAHTQVQLDVYGELMDTAHQARCAGLELPRDIWDVQVVFADHVVKVWREPDAGIWEVRGPPRHFTYSKVMAWVALDRAIKSAHAFALRAPVDRWAAEREAIRAQVLAEGVDKARGVFVQSYGATGLDASLLLLAQVGFVPADDRRFVATVEAIEHELVRGGFVRRYIPDRTDDGLAGEEGAFLACNFWLADALEMIGRRDDARALFERLLAIRNDLGLLSEEYDPIGLRLAGNFPQAFSHIGLVNTAANLARAEKPNMQRAA